MKYTHAWTPRVLCAAITAAVLAGALVAVPAPPPAEARAKARLVNGKAVPPESAPYRVVRAIRAANRIAKGTGYCYGGGHWRWNSPCYDCSGAVSYALGKKGARLLKRPKSSSRLMHWRQRGKGRWITVYANRGHAYAVIAGLRFDTSMTPGAGPGWSAEMRSRRGFRVRHARRF